MNDKINLYFRDFKAIIENNKFKNGWQIDNIDGYEIRSLYHKYNTKDKEKCIWESHRNTIDCFSENKKSFKRNNYIENIDKDIWFKNDNIYHHIVLKANTFVIFLSDCLHLPQIKTKADDSIEKIVLKIPVEMI